MLPTTRQREDTWIPYTSASRTTQPCTVLPSAATMPWSMIDAGFWSVGPPTSSILSLAETRDIVIVPLSEAEIEAARGENPVFTAFTIPGVPLIGEEDIIGRLG